MGARTIQRAMKAQIAPPKVAVEARPCAWAGRATSRGERSRAAGLAPSAERCERPVARFGLDPPGGPAADCMAGRASGRQPGLRQAAGQKIPFGDDRDEPNLGQYHARPMQPTSWLGLAVAVAALIAAMVSRKLLLCSHTAIAPAKLTLRDVCAAARRLAGR